MRNFLHLGLIGGSILLTLFVTLAESEEHAGDATVEQSEPAILEDYRRLGQQVAIQTQTELGTNLKRVIQAGGPESAVSFCNVRALPITAEMSTKSGAGIKRVSDRPRNPDNAADAHELVVMEGFNDILAAGGKPAPAMQEQAGQVIGYYPIVTNSMCLQCHGAVGDDIAASTYRVIREEYPEDQAVGYGENQLRGLFVVKMDKSADENQQDGGLSPQRP